MVNVVKRYELVPLGKIVPSAMNPRKHTQAQVAQIRASFREYGVISPCVVDEDYNLLAGHGRLLGAQAEGLSEINCVVVEGLTPAQKRAYIITDNKLTENSEWDTDLLAANFADLKDVGFDLELTGFDADELDKLFATSDAEVADDDKFNLTAALEAATFVEPGDIWLLGRHRLICGDATDPTTVARLMNGNKANLVVTDLPYNVGFESASGLTIKNDKMAGDKFYEFIFAAFTNLAASLDAGGSIYVFHADTEGENFRRAFREAGFHLSGTCIWAKNSLVMSKSPYQWQHEPILFGWLKNGTHKWYSDRKQTTIWNFDKPRKNEFHPTMKPLDLLAYPIKNSSQANAIVLDTFGGSGSTLITCEQLDRICFMAELDEKYASVILRRYAEFKGNNGADITCQRDGQEFKYADLVKEVERA